MNRTSLCLLGLACAAFLFSAHTVLALDSAEYGTLLKTEWNGAKTLVWDADWSNDGKWVAFRANNKIWLMPSEGGTPVDVTKDITDICANPRFSCNSGEITYTRTIIVNAQIGFSIVSRIEGVDIESGARRIVMENNASAGDWSEDGKFMVFVQNAGNMNLAALKLFNNVEKTYSSVESIGRDFNWGPCISPDGSFIIFSMKVSGAYRLYRIPSSGGQPVEFASVPVQAGHQIMGPAISPNGEWILYTEISTAYESARLYVLNILSGKSAALIPDAAKPHWFGCWSPDGTKILYSVMDENRMTEFYLRDFTFADSGGGTSVKSAGPASFTLSGNHPNPFNPSTAISFSLEKAGTVELAIYDITGRKVRDLANGHMAPGRHEAVWNGRDDRGMPAASGVYFARLVSGGTTLSHRMLLMK